MWVLSPIQEANNVEVQQSTETQPTVHLSLSVLYCRNHKTIVSDMKTIESYFTNFKFVKLKDEN